MNLNEYQTLSQVTAHYPKDKAIEYTTIALCGEAGEYANEVKKMIRNDKGTLTDERRTKLIDELGDTLWYVAGCASSLGVDLTEVADRNLKKLAARHAKYVVTG